MLTCLRQLDGGLERAFVVLRAILRKDRRMQMRKMKRLFAAFTALVITCIGSVAPSVSAYGYAALPEGTYRIKAELSCYVNAMGGVEFGAPLLSAACVEVSADGSKSMTLYFTKSRVTIYGITCDTFVDASPSYITETNGIKSGTLGYYNAEGTLISDSVTYTLSDDTAENAQKEQVRYVASVTFPIEYESDTYNLTLFVNSNVMGTQFTKNGYAATLSVDWSSVSAGGFDDTADTVSSEAIQTTEPSPNAPDVENKDGMNIYYAEEPAKESDGAAETTATGYYVAYFREALLIAVGVIAGSMIVGGIALTALGERKKKHE